MTNKDDRPIIVEMVIGILFLLYLFTICVFACAGIEALAGAM